LKDRLPLWIRELGGKMDRVSLLTAGVHAIAVTGQLIEILEEDLENRGGLLAMPGLVAN
jgi:hypothetical protein